MAVKNIRRAVQGTCAVVEADGGTEAETLPSRVRLSVQRPRGGCLCLGNKSRQVAVFTFIEGQRAVKYSHALLDLERLFKYSSHENTQLKICLEQQQQQQQGVKRVARVPLEEFLQQLFCKGPCQRCFMYVHNGYITLTPDTSPNHVPQWPFEGSGSSDKYEAEDESDPTETACVTNDDITMNDTLTGREEQRQEECLNKQVPPPDGDKEESSSEEDKSNEESDSECVTDEEQSLSENHDQQLNCDQDNVTDSDNVTDKDRLTAETDVTDSDNVTDKDRLTAEIDVTDSDNVTDKDRLTAETDVTDSDNVTDKDRLTAEIDVTDSDNVTDKDRLTAETDITAV